MPKEITFQSSAFNTKDSRDYFINPCCFGDDLAKWLIQRLRSEGIQTDDEPGQEDFGWYFSFTVAETPHCCLVGFQEDEPEGLWRVFIERERGFIGSVLGFRNRGIQDSAVKAVVGVLRSSPEVKNIEQGAF